MNTQHIKHWIVENLKGNRRSVPAHHATGIHAIWGQHKATNGKYYDARIIYLVKNQEHGRFVATEGNLADSINFTSHQTHHTYEQEKLNKLVAEIANSVKKGGRYKLEILLDNTWRVTLF